jgi:hypothetical protein
VGGKCAAPCAQASLGKKLAGWGNGPWLPSPLDLAFVFQKRSDSTVIHWGAVMNDVQILGDIAAEFTSEQNVTIGKWFGKSCLKVEGKVFAAFWRGDMAFRITGKARHEALQVEGSRLFDPRGEGHPMKEWVQIPAAQSSEWNHFAKLACKYVAGAAQAKKDEIISGLVEVRRRILDEASKLSPVEQDQVFLGIWTVKDMLAHLEGWDHTNLKAVEAILAGQRPSFWEYYDHDWETYNARLVAEYGQDDFAELVASVKESHRKLMNFLQTVPADEYIRKKKIVTLLRAEIKDENTHYGQVKEFREHRAA